MKTSIITGALLLNISLLSAQSAKDKPVTVRIKKIENVNGVEKITDTTYITTDAAVIKDEDTDIRVIETVGQKDKECKKTVIVNGNVVSTGGADVKTITPGDDINMEIEKALKEAGVDPNGKDVQKMIVVNSECKKENKENGKRVTKVVVIKNVRIAEASETDQQLAGKTTGLTDGKLSVDQMKFYPNPANGKFNLAFSLPEKGDMTLTIMDMQGKAVYNEMLQEFSGNYNKEIDLSSQPKGTYLIRVEQNGHAQLKKVVME